MPGGSHPISWTPKENKDYFLGPRGILPADNFQTWTAMLAHPKSPAWGPTVQILDLQVSIILWASFLE